MTVRLRLVALLGLLLAVALSACAVPAEPTPRALPPEALEALQGSEPAGSTGPGLLYELWFVRENQLVPVDRQSEEPLTPERELSLLEAGPTAQEKEEGLRTAQVSVVPDSPLAVTSEEAGLPVQSTDKRIAVVLSDGFGDLPSQEQLLVLGQIVLTLADEPEESVLFVNSSGTPVGVPLPNGRLSSGAVTANNYSSLTG